MPHWKRGNMMVKEKRDTKQQFKIIDNADNINLLLGLYHSQRLGVISLSEIHEGIVSQLRSFEQFIQCARNLSRFLEEDVNLDHEHLLTQEKCTCIECRHRKNLSADEIRK